MLKLSKKVEYALIALLYMEQRAGNAPVPAKDVAESFDVPGELLGKVLQSLARAEVVESVKGARGGYRLRRSLDEVSVGNVIEAVEGPVLIVPCCDGSDTCRQHEACNIRAPIQRIQEQVQEFIHEMPLSSFRSSDDAAPAKLRKELPL